ncbi:MAG TPA: helix-turn-helix transcriptional regulator [Gemmatimonadales bacterium]|nr:helix-turn-helix transcriptional regulator [Gemmatimonadales bacterium]
MPTSEKRTRARRPSPPRQKQKGGAWGDGLRDRLRVLIKESGSSAGFGRMCGIESPRISEWLAGVQLPSLRYLQIICDKTHVSADWLLFGPGVEPLYREDARPRSDLETELAVTVRRHIHAREADGAFDTPEGSVRVSLENWLVDGAGLLRDLLATEEEKVKHWLAWEARTDALRGVADDIMQALEAFVPLLPARDTELGRHIYTLGGAAAEARMFGAGLGVPEEPNSYRGFKGRPQSHPVVGPPTALRYVKAELAELEDAPNPLARRIKSGKARLAPRGTEA